MQGRAADILPLCCLCVVSPLRGGCFSLCCVLGGNYCCQIPAVLSSIFSEYFLPVLKPLLGPITVLFLRGLELHRELLPHWHVPVCSGSAATSGVPFPPKTSDPVSPSLEKGDAVTQPSGKFPWNLDCSKTCQICEHKKSSAEVYFYHKEFCRWSNKNTARSVPGLKAAGRNAGFLQSCQ